MVGLASQMLSQANMNQPSLGLELATARNDRAGLLDIDCALV